MNKYTVFQVIIAFLGVFQVGILSGLSLASVGNFLLNKNIISSAGALITKSVDGISGAVVYGADALLGSGPYAKGFNGAGLALVGLGGYGVYQLMTDEKQEKSKKSFDEQNTEHFKSKIYDTQHNYFPKNDEEPDNSCMERIANTTIDYFACFPWLPTAFLTFCAAGFAQAHNNNFANTLFTGTVGVLSTGMFAKYCFLNKHLSYYMTLNEVASFIPNLKQCYGIMGTALALVTVGTALRFAHK